MTCSISHRTFLFPLIFTCITFALILWSFTCILPMLVHRSWHDRFLISIWYTSSAFTNLLRRWARFIRLWTFLFTAEIVLFINFLREYFDSSTFARYIVNLAASRTSSSFVILNKLICQIARYVYQFFCILRWFLNRWVRYLGHPYVLLSLGFVGERLCKNFLYHQFRLLTFLLLIWLHISTLINRNSLILALYSHILLRANLIVKSV